MKTYEETLRFKDEGAIREWLANPCAILRRALSVGEPFLEGAIDYAPWAITLTLPVEES